MAAEEPKEPPVSIKESFTILKYPIFWCLFLGYFCGIGYGLLIVTRKFSKQTTLSIAIPVETFFSLLEQNNKVVDFKQDTYFVFLLHFVETSGLWDAFLGCPDSPSCADRSDWVSYISMAFSICNAFAAFVSGSLSDFCVKKVRLFPPVHL